MCRVDAQSFRGLCGRDDLLVSTGAAGNKTRVSCSSLAEGSATGHRAQGKKQRKGDKSKESWFQKEMIPLEASDWKAGKKSQVFPRSGNKSFSFKDKSYQDKTDQDQDFR